MKGNFKKGISVALSLALTVSSFALPDTAKNVNADNLPTTKLGVGSIGTGSNEPDAAKLPRTSTQGKYRFTTDNYNSKHKALDTNDWASNWLWDLEGDRDTDSTNALSGTAYALPLCYLMKKDGLRVTKPAMTSSNTNVSAYNIKDNDTLCDFKISPDWTCTNNNIDEVTDWSYKAVTTNPQNAGQKMYTTMTQGSPFAFIEMENTNTIYLEKLRVTFPSEIIYEDTYNGSKMVVFRTNDITSSVNGYPSATYQYYAVFLPENTTVTHMGTTDKTNNDKIGKLKFTFPSNNKAYMSVAWLCESRNIDNNMGIKYAKEYRPYAFNIITNTTADYSYNESTGNVQTKYTYSFSKKAESTADGTIMGILPHQYKNMSNVTYMDNKAITLRGYMKFIKGSSYTTNMTYNGIIPYMPSLSSDDSQGREELQKYVNNFVNKYMTGAGNWTLANDEGNETYYHGKKLNRSAQVVAAAKAVGDEGNAQKVLNGLEKNLEDWFTYSGNSDKHYFTYLGEGVGALLGFQSSFNSVDQFNDHHFHYGYFIESAASVGLYDREWLNNYKDVVKQLIYDIACPYRNNKECVADCGNAYPYLRSFSPYEGHSWASGYEDERTGMVATNSVAVRTGNVSAGTSVFAMIVLEKELSRPYKEIDMVTTPSGHLVAMAHSNNCTSDLNAWVNVFKEFAEAMGMEVDMNKLFGTLYNKALEGDPDCGGLLSYCYFSGEHMTGFEEGRPLFVRSPESKFNLANFMRTNLYTCLGAMRVGLNLLFEKENVKVDRLLGHGGLFKTKGVGQQILADAVNAPVSVMATAGEGGAWGIALLASYLVNKEEGETLESFLDNKVFADQESSTLDPKPEGVAGFNAFMDSYMKGLSIERAAVESEIW